MTPYLNRLLYILLIFISAFILLKLILPVQKDMAHASSDVAHLREQYNAGKSHSNALTVAYHHKQFNDGDTLKKSDTQALPQVQINADVDPQYPYFTLVIFQY